MMHNVYVIIVSNYEMPVSVCECYNCVLGETLSASLLYCDGGQKSDDTAAANVLEPVGSKCVCVSGRRGVGSEFMSAYYV